MTKEEMMTIRTWHGPDFKPDIEEDMNDIFLMIGYSDHGDDFIYVQTKDGHEYEYGYWCDIRWHDDYDELIKADPERLKNYGYIRLPKLYKQEDKESRLSNDIFICFDKWLKYSDHDLKSWKPASPGWDAEFKFNLIIKKFKEAFDSGLYYDWEEKRQVLYDFLEKCELDTPENIEIVRTLPMSSKIDGYDGIAAKRQTHHKYAMTFDHLNFVIKKGEELNLSDVITIMDDEVDDFGIVSEVLYLDQFLDDSKSKICNECIGLIHDRIKELNNLGKTLSERNLEELLYIRNELERMFNY